MYKHAVVCNLITKCGFVISSLGDVVAKEVKRIMSPLPTVSYDPKSRDRSFASSSAIPSKMKRKGKFSVANEKYGECSKKFKPGSAFQKKLVVFGYMGSNAPTQFTRKDSAIVMRGLLPDISVNAPEDDVRKEICEVIRGINEHDAHLCQPEYFEFIDMNGKNASVLNVKSGYSFTGKAVKNLAGTGCVYVRMTRELFSTYISSDDNSPKVKDELINGIDREPVSPFNFPGYFHSSDGSSSLSTSEPGSSSHSTSKKGSLSTSEPGSSSHSTSEQGSHLSHSTSERSTAGSSVQITHELNISGSSPYHGTNTQHGVVEVDINKLFELFPQVPRDTFFC